MQNVRQRGILCHLFVHIHLANVNLCCVQFLEERLTLAPQIECSFASRTQHRLIVAPLLLIDFCPYLITYPGNRTTKESLSALLMEENPLLSADSYTKRLITTVESVIKRMQWNAFASYRKAVRRRQRRTTKTITRNQIFFSRFLFILLAFRLMIALARNSKQRANFRSYPCVFIPLTSECAHCEMCTCWQVYAGKDGTKWKGRVAWLDCVISYSYGIVYVWSGINNKQTIINVCSLTDVVTLVFHLRFQAPPAPATTPAPTTDLPVLNIRKKCSCMHALAMCLSLPRVLLINLSTCCR